MSPKALILGGTAAIAIAAFTTTALQAKTLERVSSVTINGIEQIRVRTGRLLGKIILGIENPSKAQVTIERVIVRLQKKGKDGSWSTVGQTTPLPNGGTIVPENVSNLPIQFALPLSSLISTTLSVLFGQKLELRAAIEIYIKGLGRIESFEPIELPEISSLLGVPAHVQIKPLQTISI